MGKLDKENLKYIYTLATDITDVCNLRCSFCLRDFNNTKSPNVGYAKQPHMSEEVFDRVLKIASYINEHGHLKVYLFSCLFEPSLHPRFIHYLEKIPEEIRSKTFFTTSLTTKAYDSDELLERLSKSGKLQYLNISLDSFDKEIFEHLRTGADFDFFMNNLKRLVRFFERNPETASPLSYLTMAFKMNLLEIPSIVDRCSQDYLAEKHEIRYIFPSFDDRFSADWKIENLLSNDDWNWLSKECAPKANCLVASPPNCYYPDDNQPYSRNIPDDTPKEEMAPGEIGINSDGTMWGYPPDGPVRILGNVFDIEGL